MMDEAELESKVLARCHQCKGKIFEDETVVKYDCEIFCDTTCALSYMMDEGDLKIEIVGEDHE